MNKEVEIPISCSLLFQLMEAESSQSSTTKLTIKISNGITLRNTDKFIILLTQIKELMPTPDQAEDFNLLKETMLVNGKEITTTPHLINF